MIFRKESSTYNKKYSWYAHSQSFLLLYVLLSLLNVILLYSSLYSYTDFWSKHCYKHIDGYMLWRFFSLDAPQWSEKVIPRWDCYRFTAKYLWEWRERLIWNLRKEVKGRRQLLGLNSYSCRFSFYHYLNSWFYHSIPCGGNGVVELETYFSLAAGTLIGKIEPCQWQI